MNKPDATPPSHFLRQIVQADLDSGKHNSIVTRFPPEPNGYLHIGHAKSICLNFGLAREFGGVCHLRFDDTNPAKEEQEYIDAIKADVEWLGFEWGGDVRYASDYFDQLHAWAIELIKAGKAYVCELTPEQAREYRGTLTEPGKDSPFRERSVDENLDQFQRMTAGEFADGAKVVRAKIDMSAPNMNLRSSTVFVTHITTRLAINGACTRAMTSPMVSLTPWKASRTRSAPWSLKTTARCTSGSWPICRCRRSHVSTSLPV